MVRVTLLYFASVREILGRDTEDRELPEDVETARDLMQWLITLDEHYARAFALPDKLRCAIDQTMAPLDAPISGATEIAFFPPVTGG